MNKKSILLFLLFSPIIVFGQKKDTVFSPLEEFFQKNYDSTVIYYKVDAFQSLPVYYILAKANDTVYYYQYKFNENGYPADHVGPRASGMNYKLYKIYMNYSYKSKPDINTYFSWLKTEKTNGSLWENIQSNNLWNFIDDHNIELIKDEEDHRYEILDGHAYVFRLITKNEVIFLLYDCPEIFNSFKENATRKKIIDLKKSIVDYFNEIKKYTK